MKRYKSTGVVLGNLWGGGIGAYPSEELEAKTKKGLISKAKRMLETGGLDGGMGFDGLNSAILMIEEIETTTKNGKKYQRSEYEEGFIGKSSDLDKTFLKECAIRYNL